jgi:hypothetical protein
MDGPEGGEHPMPGGGGPLQSVLAGVASAFMQLPREGADGVGVGVGVVVDTQQAPFFGVEQEHHTHQHGDGALVHLGRPHRGRQQRLAVLCAVFGVEPADRRHQHLDHRPGLLGQPGGDLFLAVQAGREQRGQGLVFGNAEEPEPAQQCSERLKGVRFVEPGVADPRGGSGGPTGGGADQCPFGAVGDQTEGSPARPQGVPEAVGETRRPFAAAGGSGSGTGRGAHPGVDDDAQQQRRRGGIIRVGQQREVGAHFGAVFGDRGGQSGGHMACADEIGLPAQKARQDMADECVAGARAGVEDATGLTQCTHVVDIQGGQPAGPDVFDHRGGQEWAV